ncbi:hypothetical protein V5799_011894 [Amblyomma americanum]|uniref:Uncharacterized protein n=1 Tax=Amblyomma americanum TaxID=6943 RepID=A0AAQ4EFX9_AMBAM
MSVTNCSAPLALECRCRRDLARTERLELLLEHRGKTESGESGESLSSRERLPRRPGGTVEWFRVGFALPPWKEDLQSIPLIAYCDQ